MEKKINPIQVINEFIEWYDKREELPSNKLHEFYLKFKNILDKDNEANEAIRKFLG